MVRIRELDGLRFLAIAAVLAVHYRPPFNSAYDLLSIGWMGVDLFFVISGFLITTNLLSLRESPHPYRTFYWRRTLRIFPAYYLVLLTLCVIQLSRHAHLQRAPTLAAFVFLNSFVIHPPVHATFAFLLHGVRSGHSSMLLDQHVFTSFQDGIGIFWSLSIEELFYLLWAPVMLKLKEKRIWIISLLVILTTPILRALVHSPTYEENFFFPCRGDTLMAGSLLALLFAACNKGIIRRSTLNRSLSVATAVSLAALAFLLVHDGLFRHIEVRSTWSFAFLGYSLLAMFFTSIVGLCALNGDGTDLWARMLRARPFVFVGTVSYMMYLVHIPVWVAIYMTAARVKPRLPVEWIGVFAAAGTVTIAAISWKYFERPILKFKDSAFGLPPRAEAREKQILKP